MSRTAITHRLRDESGVALVAAILALVIGLLLATAVVLAATGESFNSNRDTAVKRAFEAAQAGLQQTAYDMNTLLNSSSLLPSVLEDKCVAGASTSVNAQETLADPSLSFSTVINANVVCGPDTQSLGNGSFYTSWTSRTLGNSGQSCTGATVGTQQLVTDRCIVSQGIICPPSYSAPTCPNPVIHRVEERLAAATGKPLFPLQGIIAPNGVLIRNTGTVNGNISTNEQLSLQQSAKVPNPVTLSTSPVAPYPLISNSATLGTGLVCNSTNAPTYTSTNTWPAACVQRYTLNGQPAGFLLSDDPPPYPEYTDNGRITCAESGQTCPHDTFSTSSGPCFVNATGCATWNPTTRSLNIPNGVTWTIGGGTYSFCTFNMTGGSSGTQAVLANGVKTEIYIDSPANSSYSTVSGQCPQGTGTITEGQGAAFVNNSPPLPGSPLAHDTTALFIYVYGNISPIPDTGAGSATYNYNSCNLNGNTTDASCVQFGQSGNFYGTVYAPESDVKITNTGQTYGGIAGRTVTFDNPGTFTQDVNVTNLITTAIRALYFRSGWTECYPSPTVSTNPMSGC
jgi:Tfp pilus assembly protein PilX